MGAHIAGMHFDAQQAIDVIDDQIARMRGKIERGQMPRLDIARSAAHADGQVLRDVDFDVEIGVVGAERIDVDVIGLMRHQHDRVAVAALIERDFAKAVLSRGAGAAANLDAADARIADEAHVGGFEPGLEQAHAGRVDVEIAGFLERAFGGAGGRKKSTSPARIADRMVFLRWICGSDAAGPLRV